MLLKIFESSFDAAKPIGILRNRLQLTADLWGAAKFDANLLGAEKFDANLLGAEKFDADLLGAEKFDTDLLDAAELKMVHNEVAQFSDDH